MSSSISSSEPSGAERFFKPFLITALIAAPLMLGFLMLIDPYDTGRFTFARKPTMFVTGPRVSNVSRMRDTAFNAVIIGNSTTQLLMPERLNGLAGLSFVQLSTPATGPNEQKAMVQAFARIRGAETKALVLGMDRTWCDAAREKTTGVPFPFWLYSASPLTYLTGLFRMDSLEAVPRRIGLFLGREKRAAQDGYWNTEQDYIAIERRGPLPDRAFEESTPPPPVNGRFAADSALREALAALPATTRVVLLHPPIFASGRDYGDAHRQRLGACKSALTKVAAERPLTAVIDRWNDSPVNRDRRLFFDHNHYRTPMAIDVEAEVARALNAMPGI